MISLDTIFAKHLADITPQEDDYLKEHESQLSDEQKETYKTNLENAEKKLEPKENTDEKTDEKKEEVKIEVKQIKLQDCINAIEQIKKIVNKLN